MALEYRVQKLEARFGRGDNPEGPVLIVACPCGISEEAIREREDAECARTGINREDVVMWIHLTSPAPGEIEAQ